MNAIALKELRQIVRSKLVLIVIHLFLIAQIVAIVIAVYASITISGTPSYNNIGDNVSIGIRIISALFLLLFIPVYTFIKAWNEHSDVNMDLYFVTAITPWYILRGKIIAYSTLALLFVCMSLGMTAVVYLLRGFDLYLFGEKMLTYLFIAVILNSIALFCVFSTKNRILRILTMLFVCGSFYFLLIQIMQYFYLAPPYIKYVLFALFFVIFALIYIATGVHLMPETANRSLPVRIAMTLLIIGSFICGKVTVHPSNLNDFAHVWLYVTLAIALIALLVASKENEDISFRVRKAIPRFIPYRIVLPFYSGPLYGFLWSFMIIGFAYLVLRASNTFSALKDDYYLALLYCLYTFAYILFASFIHSLLFARIMSKNKIWLIALLLIIVISSVPIVYKILPLVLTGAPLDTFRPEQVTSWMPGNLILLWHDTQYTLNFIVAGISVMIGICLNARVLWKQVKLSRPLPPVREETEPATATNDVEVSALPRG